MNTCSLRSHVSTWALHASVLAALLGGCSNMKKQPHLPLYTPSRHFANGTSAQLPPAHTVAQREPTFIPVDRDPETITEIPVPVDETLLHRGQERFDIYCAVCHGADGYGQGIIVRRGFPAPPSFHDDRLRQANVGHFYAVITRGYGMMYSYADRVKDEDRWAIAAYICALQRSQHAAPADVPPDARTQLAQR